MNTLQLTEVMAVVQRAIGTAPLRFNNERELQDELARRLAIAKSGYIVEREYWIDDGERSDFVILLPMGRFYDDDCFVAIEIKVKQPSSSILRQIKRYCASPMIDGAILICPKPVVMPPTIEGKPVGCIPIWKLMI